MAMNGFLYNGICHSTLLDAQMALVFNPSYAQMTVGPTTYYSVPGINGGLPKFFVYSVTNGVTTFHYQMYPSVSSFPACDPTLSDFAFSPVLFEMVFQKDLLLFSIGLGIGLIISLIRKLRTK